MPLEASALLRLARHVDAVATDQALRTWASELDQEHASLAALCAAAFPAMVPQFAKQRDLLAPFFTIRKPLDHEAFLSLLEAMPHHDSDQAGASVRLFVQQHKTRIALRELLPEELGGAEFVVTAAELSDLASACVQFTLDAALQEVTQRFGPPHRADGQPSSFCVLGMGKLSGHELNAGSDIDLIFIYDTDDGQAGKGDRSLSLHEFWSRVARRLVSLLDEVTAQGLAWRVDLRLRPEGTQGPIVNSVPAMLRYYETWGRTWERAALMRSRPVAGDLALGASLLRELQSFVFQRRVEPQLASQLLELSRRARAQSGGNADRDLKLGLGGIRDLEMFVQSLQLIWGGVHPSLRLLPTLQALRRLRDEGLVTDREARDLDRAYVLLRRAEHMVQYATGLQTHQLPERVDDRLRLARALGFSSADAFQQKLDTTRMRVANAIESLQPTRSVAPRRSALLAALERQDLDGVQRELAGQLGSEVAVVELASDLLHLALRPDGLLGGATRDRHPGHAEAMLDAILGSADPEQCARFLRLFFSRLASPGIHVSMLADQPHAATRFATALGASAFVGEMVARRPEVADQVLFSPGMPSADKAREEVGREIEALSPNDRLDPECIAAALRRAKLRITLEIALADLRDEVGLDQTTHVLSVLADASVHQALRASCGGDVTGVCAIAVGKFGGQELGYGSDLDLFFVFDQDGDDPDALTRFARAAQRTIRLLSAPRAEGPGYQLDTRLRPSGEQGLLVSSIRAFARYHGMHPDGRRANMTRVPAAAWERQTLLRARPCAGDMRLAERVMHLARIAAYEMGPPDAHEMHRLRMRLQTEIGRERAGRHDIKLGRGGLLDVEFAVQMLQMRHGSDERVRTPNTMQALQALEQHGYLPADDARVLRDAYQFLRRLEQRLHIVHATSIHLLELQAPGLVPLARRMALRSQPQRPATTQLIDRYLGVTSAVRQKYLRLLGIEAQG